MNLQRILAVPYLIGVTVVIIMMISGNRLPPDIIDLGGGWEYRWEAVGPWQPIAFPVNPPGRETASDPSTLYLRRRLPERVGEGWHIFVHSIDTGGLFSVEGRPIYRWNFVEGPVVARFRGWPWHMIPIAPESAGMMLELTVESDYRDIGLWGRVHLGPAQSLHQLLVRRDAAPIALTSIASIILLTALGGFLATGIRSSDWAVLATLAALIVATAAVPYARNLLSPRPLMWFYLEHAARFGVLIGATWALRRVTGPRAARLLTFLGWATLALALIANGLALGGAIRPFDMLPVLDVGTVAAFAVLFAILVGRGVTSPQLSIVIAGLAIMAALVVVSILSAYGLIAWVDSLSALVLFHLVILVLYLLLSRYEQATQRILETDGETTSELERLTEFNAHLLREKAILEQRVHHDSLTGLYSRDYTILTLEQSILEARVRYRRLSVAMLDIDYFKVVNDRFGHLIGDEVLRDLGRLLRDSLPDRVIAGRFGGEEFVLVLRDETFDTSRECIARVLKAVEDASWPHAQTLTMSAGLAEYDGGTARQLLATADRALYRAKQAGRNQLAWDRRSAEDGARD